MWRLTREVRFAVNLPGAKSAPAVINGHGGYPPLAGLGHYFTLRVTVSGAARGDTGCVVNIKEIDLAVRRQVVALVERRIAGGTFGGGGNVAAEVREMLSRALPSADVHAVRLGLSPYLSWSALAEELPMVRLSQRFEFSASHRLHNPKLSDDDNRRLFGKCNNPHGHGHNYELEVTVAGTPDANGVLIEVSELERIVEQAVLSRLDHRNLNVEVPQFAELIPTVENIAKVAWDLLRPHLSGLVSVTVWETPKTWAEYSEIE